MTPATITISTEDESVIDRLRAGMDSRELFDLFGLKFAGVKLETYTNLGHPHAVMISQQVSMVETVVAPQWSGEGLPPTGTVCEIAASTEYLKISYPEGAEVKIYANFRHDCGREFAAFVDSNCQVYGIGMAKVFRPIRTPEQIAADEREAAINEMIGKIKDHPDKYKAVSHFAQLKIQEDACADLYDAGLRLPKGDAK